MKSIIFICLCLFNFIYSSTLDRYDQIKAKDFHLIDSNGNIIMSFSEFNMDKFDSLFYMIKINKDLIQINEDLTQTNKEEIDRHNLKIEDLNENSAVLFNNKIHKHSIQILQIEKMLVEINSKLDNNKGTHSQMVSPPSDEGGDVDFVAFDKAPKAIITIQENIEYPLYAKNNGIEGTIYVKFYIDKKGNVDPNQISVIKGVPALNNAAIAAVKKSKWKPAQQGDMRVGVYQTIPIKFELR